MKDAIHARRREIVSALLAGVVLIFAVRMAVYAADFASNSLQMDFAARYAAIRSLMAGEDPYINNLRISVALWDGIATSTHSRYLYPPSLALLLYPLGVLPYHAAKIVWMFVGLFALAVALIVAARLSQQKIDTPVALGLAAIALAFWPLLVHMERAQFDSVNLMMVMLGAWFIQGRRPALAGASFGLAVILKLNCLYLFPFLIGTRRWRVLGIALLTLLTASTVSGAVFGFRHEFKYWTQELWFISQIDEYADPLGPELPPEIVQNTPRALNGSRVMLQGREYETSRLEFAGNATAVRPLRRYMLSRLPAHAPKSSTLSGLMFLCFTGCVAVWAWHRRRKRWNQYEGDEILSFWLLALVLVALTAPLTWTMNAVWILPSACLLAKDLRAGSGRLSFVVAGAAGLALAAVPDGSLLSPNSSLVTQLLRDWKYPLAEGLVAVYLLERLTCRSAPADPMQSDAR